MTYLPVASITSGVRRNGQLVALADRLDALPLDQDRLAEDRLVGDAVDDRGAGDEHGHVESSFSIASDQVRTAGRRDHRQTCSQTRSQLPPSTAMMSASE